MQILLNLAVSLSQRPVHGASYQDKQHSYQEAESNVTLSASGSITKINKQYYSPSEELPRTGNSLFQSINTSMVPSGSLLSAHS